MPPKNVISFRQAKKKVKQSRKDKQAAENRVKFGRTRSEKQVDKAQADQHKSKVDGHRLDPDEPSTP